MEVKICRYIIMQLQSSNIKPKKYNIVKSMLTRPIGALFTANSFLKGSKINTKLCYPHKINLYF